jgi:RNA polymerase sigma-54 factor
MRQEFSFRQNQLLVLNTAMRQALHVLTLPTIELEQWLVQQIEANPLLELDESATASPPMREPSEQKSLFRHLMDQVPLHFSSIEEREMAHWIIGNIDERGFFEGPEKPSPFFQRVLKMVQQLDPPGVAAKDLRESLLFQLEAQDKANSAAYLLIRDHFDEILKGSRPQLLNEVRGEISCLNFYLGSNFSSSLVKPVKPDLMIRNSPVGWHVEVRSSELPTFTFIESYLNLLNQGEISEEEKSFIRSHIAAGKWLNRALSHRQRHLMAIGQYLTQKQPQCFAGEPPKPLTLQEAARDLDIHPSTMTRATQDKYCLCEAGMLPLRAFFSRELQEERSTEMAKALLKKLIASEDRHAPLSDQLLTKKIQEQGVSCARRTVTKYRQALKIPSAKERRRT